MGDILDALLVESGKYALRAMEEHKAWEQATPGRDAMRKALAEECCRKVCDALNAAASDVFAAMNAALNLDRLDALMDEEASK